VVDERPHAGEPGPYPADQEPPAARRGGQVHLVAEDAMDGREE